MVSSLFLKQKHSKTNSHLTVQGSRPGLNKEIGKQQQQQKQRKENNKLAK
jgi:hypothetical protein